MSVAAAARHVVDNKVYFVGVGLPMMATALAQRLYAPHITVIFEGGSIQPVASTRYMPFSPNDSRSCFKAVALSSTTDVLTLMQRGHVDYGFIAGAQIDQYGNVNTSFIGDFRKPKTRLPGSGGANDIASFGKVMILTKHEKRRFVEKVDFITSPGNVDARGRESHGLVFGGPYKVFTDLAEMGYDSKDKRVTLKALHPRVTIEDVLNKMSFKPNIPTRLEETKPPTQYELEFLRQMDPEGRWVSHPS